MGVSCGVMARGCAGCCKERMSVCSGYGWVGSVHAWLSRLSYLLFISRLVAKKADLGHRACRESVSRVVLPPLGRVST